MTANTPLDLDTLTLVDLETQRIAIDSQFSKKDYKALDLAILQPADCFLELSGEDIRRRTYVFTDAFGKELCLRPDLTIPTCRSYLEKHRTKPDVARYAYHGLAFRSQNPQSAKPTEFPQAGIELIGAPSTPDEDAEVFSLTVAAIEAAGLQGFDITMGDLGLFSELINVLDMPDVWRRRLARSLWRPHEFARLLEVLSRKGDEAPGLLSILGGLDEGEARAVLSDLLDVASVEPIGGRSLDDITDRLMEKAFDQGAEALPEETVKLIHDYLDISGTPNQVFDKIEATTKAAGVSLEKTLSNARMRMKQINDTGIPSDRIRFVTEFGRNMDYYTGFVFELCVPELGDDAQIAGGGRYDNLLKRLGANKDIPAVGAMIRPDRLLRARQLNSGRSMA